MQKLKSIFKSNDPIVIEDNFIKLKSRSSKKNQNQTNISFSEKWSVVNKQKENDEFIFESFQKKWFLDLYGFSDEAELAQFLSGKIILDAGCGLGYKSKWFASLAPDSIVIAMDYSEAAQIGGSLYQKIDNLFFIQGDIADTNFKENSIDIVVCDQVIMHTEKPDDTFKHLASIINLNGEFLCYVYSKKALPRELLDDYFRKETHNLTSKEIWELSRQLTELGKRLSNLNVSFESPDIPLLGIKGGKYDIQRFIYWNFIKCFFNEELGFENSVAGNFDWYSPSNAKRFSEIEFKSMINESNLEIEYFHSEEACYSGRFKKSI